jgi:hypothetical protein
MSRPVHINEVKDFIRKNDYQGYFKDYSNGKLRSYIVSALKNECFFINHKKESITGIIEYYKGKNYRDLAEKLMVGLNKKIIPPNVGQGQTIWINNIITIQKMNFRYLLGKFKRYIKDFDNIYWWKYKNNKVFLCRLRRKD